MCTTEINFTLYNNKKDNNMLSKVKPDMDEQYKKYWNITEGDFFGLAKDGKLLRNTLYREGNSSGMNQDTYFMLMKHTEAFYPDSITTDPDKKRHLACHWCIIDKEGNEKIVFEEFHHGYLISNSCIYTIDNYYFNIETKEKICKSYQSMKSENYLFLSPVPESLKDLKNRKHIVLKVDKKTGAYEVIE